jgi:DNA mismatch repair protein MutS
MEQGVFDLSKRSALSANAGGRQHSSIPSWNYRPTWRHFPAIQENQNDIRLNACHILNYTEPYKSLYIYYEFLLYTRFESKLKKTRRSLNWKINHLSGRTDRKDDRMKREKAFFEQGNGPAGFSLLQPKGPGVSLNQKDLFLELDPVAAHDLQLDEIVATFTPDRAYQKEIQPLFHQLPRDPQVILYRQAVLEDLLTNPGLVERLTSLLPVINSLFGYLHRPKPEMSWLHEVVWRAEELQNIIECFEGMGQALDLAESNIHSEGLRYLQEEIRKARNDPKYQSLMKELPVILARLQGTASITIGINLDSSLRPIQATLLSVQEKPFTDQSLLNRLFGVQTGREGIAPLHSVPANVPGLEGPVDPLMVPLFADLARVLEKTAIPIADQLNRYAALHGGLFMDLRQALIFYLGAIRIIRRFDGLGLPMCRPQIAPVKERRCEVKDSYNLQLVLRHTKSNQELGPAVILNDIGMGSEGRIFILTGPNGGGKTTYMQGVGVVHILAQLGCYVPGKQAIVSPLDRLFTHFPLEEKPESDTGRFGEEAIRLGKIFKGVTRHSLVLLNESLSSTSFSESLYLAQDIVRLLRRIGARAIYSTHLHELANNVDELNVSAAGDSKIISVVSSPIDPAVEATQSDMQHLYKLEMRPPLGQSYAREVAARYGISYQQLEDVLSKRGVL